MARALASDDAAMWCRVEPETWSGLLARFLPWADAWMIAAVEVEPPEALKGRLENQVRYPHTGGPVRLSLPQLVAWLYAGLQNGRLNGVAALPGPVGRTRHH